MHPNTIKGLRIGWRLASKRKNPSNNRICVICQSPFYRRGNRHAKCCSRKCSYVLTTLRPATCKGANHYAFKGQYVSGGRMFVYAPEHPNRIKSTVYVLRSRLVAGEKLGRPLHDWETVHHKNEDKLDDRPDNLEVLTHSAHMRLHALVKPRHPATKQFIK